LGGGKKLIAERFAAMDSFAQIRGIGAKFVGDVPVPGNLVHQTAQAIDLVRRSVHGLQFRKRFGIGAAGDNDWGIAEVGEDDLAREVAHGHKLAARHGDELAPLAGRAFKSDKRGELLTAVIVFVTGHEEWLQERRW
jgi:hypothetical protein